MKLPPSSIPVIFLPLPSGRALLSGNTTQLGLFLSIACIALVAFSFLKRGSKESTEEVPPVREETDAPAPPEEDLGIDGLLSRARYPLTERAALVRAIGGEDAEIDVGGSHILPGGEFADRVFSLARRFQSKADVLQAFDKSSWITYVMSTVNMVPFPLRSASDFPKGLARGYIEGVKVEELLGGLQFPVENASDLLIELSDARFGRRKMDKPTRTVKVSPDPGETPEPGPQSMVAPAHIGHGPDAPDEVAG